MLEPVGLRKITIAILAFACLVTAPVVTSRAYASNLVVAQAEITLSEAINIVRQQTGGHILSAKKVNTAEPIYLIKVLLPSGQVKSYRVSASTGKIL